MVMHMNQSAAKSEPKGDGSLLTIEELAEYLDVPVATVRTWRANKTGPRGIRVGRHVRYRRADIEDWLELRSDPRPRW
jgi:excisionase family DNA binding protein